MTRRHGTAGVVRLRIHVQPRATRNHIAGRHGEAWKVQVHAAPEDGAANAALIALLAEELGVPRRSIRIVFGATARDKLIEIAGADPVECQRRLQAALGPAAGIRSAGRSPMGR